MDVEREMEPDNMNLTHQELESLLNTIATNTTYKVITVALDTLADAIEKITISGGTEQNRKGFRLGITSAASLVREAAQAARSKQA